MTDEKMTMPTACEHKFIIKDGASQSETYKIAFCEKCLYIGKIQPRNEKPKEDSIWDIKDRRITRMSVIKSAIDFHSVQEVKNLKDVLDTAEMFESWVYRRIT